VSPRGGTRQRAVRKPVIVLAGEDSNDRQCLRIAIEALCPAAKGRIVEINDAVRLRQASHENLTARVDKLARVARARAARENAEIAAVFVHEDYDAVDSDQRQGVRRRVQDALRVHDPKQVLMREVSGKGPRYRESDAPKVLQKAVDLAVLGNPTGTNCSWHELSGYIRALS
jgi:hypothetical protein